jgi:ParB family chromosome partitioning protein
MNMEKEVLILNIDDVLPNRFQPRIKFKEENINELAESIKEHGVIQPIVVRKISDKYEIIAGERRYKASILAGKTTIPAIVTDLDDKNSAEVALIENVQRQNLTPIEEAISYKKILDMGYINQTDLAEKLGKTQSTIANKLRLLNLDEEVQEALLNEKISERHARSLLKLDKNKQVEMLNRIISERMTVRKTDEEINKILNNNSEEKQEVNIPSLNKVDENNSEIEVLNFDLDEQESSKENELEKTMKIPPITEKEVNNTMNENQNINSIPELNNQVQDNNFNTENVLNNQVQNNNINNENTLNNQNSNINEIPSVNSFNNQEIPVENQNNTFNNNTINVPNLNQQDLNNNQIEVPNVIQQESNNNVSEISDNVSQNLNNTENQFNIPSEPIIEPETNQDSSFNVQNNNFNFSQQLDVTPSEDDNISPVTPVEEVNVGQNPIDIASLPSNNQQESPTPVEINPMMEQPESNDSNPSGGGKFFNMFNMNNQNYVDDIENKEVNMNFEEQNQPAANPFNFNFDPINQPSSQTNESTVNSLNQPQSNIATPDIFSNTGISNNMDNSVQQTSNINESNNMNLQNNQIENSDNEDPFENKLNPYTLNDDEQFTNPAEMQNQMQPEVTNQGIMQQPNVQPSLNQNQAINVPQEKFVTGNLRTAINTIRECADTIEKYGFNIETEELDFEDSYQVTFKIAKK